MVCPEAIVDWSISFGSHTLPSTWNCLLLHSFHRPLFTSALFLPLSSLVFHLFTNLLLFLFWLFFVCFLPRPFFFLSFPYGRISTEHSPKLQIRSHSYLRAVSEVSINRSLDSLDPAGLLASPKFRSRNESYMRAMSTISQVGGTLAPMPVFC